jgi:hypothetical protein
MKTNRDLLKEAIADAKAVKETAIANAKAALEEAFTPHLKELFASKLEEMDLDEEAEEMDEMMTYDEMEEAKKEKSETKEEKSKMEEEMDLEELLAELNEAEEEGEAEEEEEEEGEAEETEEEVEVSEMSEEDLKTFIEDVIKDMVAAGELEAGGEAETEAGTEETGTVDEEVNLEELLAEVEAAQENENLEEFVGKVAGALKKGAETVGKFIAAAVTHPMLKQYNKVKGDILKSMSADEIIADFNKWAKTTSFTGPETQAARSELMQSLGKEVRPTSGATAAISGMGESIEENAELEEAYSTIETLKQELHEVNLLNAKLLYTNKIFKAKNLTDPQKVKVLESFDKATTVNEVKLVFETLTESLNNKTTVTESKVRGFASKTTAPVVNTKQPIIESNDAFARMQRLAGLR